jgi:SNF2 family DNA or RNA helicase
MLYSIPKYNRAYPKNGRSLWEPTYLKALIDKHSSEHNWHIELNSNSATIIADNHHKFELHFTKSLEHVSCSCHKFIEEGLNWCQHLSALNRFMFTNHKEFNSMKHKNKPDILFYNSKDETFYIPAKNREINREGIPNITATHSSSIHNCLNKFSFIPGWIPELLNPFPTINLYGYQEKAIRHMLHYKRTILSLEMGWGKTLCALACIKHHLAQNNDLKIIVICPKSLKSQWEKEIATHIGASTQNVKNKNDKLQDATFAIFNYESLRDYSNDLKCDILILDEVQKIKNKNTKSWKAISKINSTYCWALSGTVVENNVEDFLAIADILRPDLFKTRWKFYDKFCEIDGRFIRGFKNSKDLHDLLETIIYRAPDGESPLTLELNHTVIKVKMSPKQKKLHDFYYHEVKKLLAMSMNRMLTFSEKIMLSAYQTKTRMVADSGWLVDANFGEPTKKIEAIVKMVQNTDGKIVIFSEWKEFLNKLEISFYKLGIKTVRFDGSLSQKKRKDAITAFTTNPDIKLFMSTDAGGVGVDGLQHVSNTIIHCQMSWNPARLEQRNGRLFRIGQTKPVKSFLFLSEGSIEESIIMTHQRKTEIKNVIFGK